MHYNCYRCDNDDCQTGFAIESLSDQGDPTCPYCGSETTDTNEAIKDPRIVPISEINQ